MWKLGTKEMKLPTEQVSMGVNDYGIEFPQVQNTHIILSNQSQETRKKAWGEFTGSHINKPGGGAVSDGTDAAPKSGD